MYRKLSLNTLSTTFVDEQLRENKDKGILTSNLQLWDIITKEKVVFSGALEKGGPSGREEVNGQSRLRTTSDR